jgi:polyisoprenoid-binding protein YceI
MPDRTVAGFDGQAVVKRTEFGMTTEFPGVSDDVKLLIEGEFEQQ